MPAPVHEGPLPSKKVVERIKELTQGIVDGTLSKDEMEELKQLLEGLPNKESVDAVAVMGDWWDCRHLRASIPGLIEFVQSRIDNYNESIRGYHDRHGNILTEMVFIGLE